MLEVTHTLLILKIVMDFPSLKKKNFPNHADVLDRYHFNLGGTIAITVRDGQWIFK